MIRPDASQADSAPMLNQLLAVSAEMLAVPAKKLAVFWLLLNNSQHPLKHLNSRRKFAQIIQHNSQQKIFLENSQKQPAFLRAPAPGYRLSENSIGSRKGAKAQREKDRPGAQLIAVRDPCGEAHLPRVTFAPSRLCV